MRKSIHLCLSVFLMLLAHATHGQIAWISEFKGSDYCGVEDISIGLGGEIFAMGNFEGGVDIGGTFYGGRGSFVMQLSREGAVQWHKVIRYSAGDLWLISHLETDRAGNVYVAGSFTNSVTIGETILEGPGFSNVFIAKFSPGGALMRTKVIPHVQEVYDFKVNAEGQMLLWTYGSIPQKVDNAVLEGGRNAFAILFAADGTGIWGKTLGGSGDYVTHPTSCALDNAGNVFVHGTYNNTLEIDGKKITSSGGIYNFFFAALTADGQCKWLTGVERTLPPPFGTDTPGSGRIIEQGGLETDGQGNVFGGGNYWQGLRAGDDMLHGNGAFIIKIDQNGTPVSLQQLPASTLHTTVDNVIIRNNRGYVSGINNQQFYVGEFELSGQTYDLTTIPILGDIASGLDVDPQHVVYMSGRQYKPATMEGFVLRLGSAITPPLPGRAGTVNGPSAFCATDESIILTTSSIPSTTSFEWEITWEGGQEIIETQERELEWQLPATQISGIVTVRVRGVNVSGKGDYSPLASLIAETPPSPPELDKSCIGLNLLSEYRSWRWYYNGVIAPQYQEKNIRPEFTGTYSVTVTNTCGSASSDHVEFTPVSKESVFIPNIITPNNDGLNDTFVVDEKIDKPALAVINRWGKEVYNNPSYAGNWDASEISAGVYFYEVRTACFDGALTGTLTIAK